MAYAAHPLSPALSYAWHRVQWQRGVDQLAEVSVDETKGRYLCTYVLMCLGVGRGGLLQFYGLTVVTLLDMQSEEGGWVVL